MKRLHLIFAALLASLAFVSCGPEEGPEGSNETAHERIIFTLLNAETPVMAAPDEEVTYKFKVSYSQGIASISTSLNGEVVEGSEVNYLDAPALAEAAPEEGTTPEDDNSAIPSVEYTFNYTIKGSQFGETLDFVFTAVGTDGYTQSVDYALWITANAVEFTVNIPEDAPAEIYSDATVTFNVAIECGNILKKIEVFKNEETYASKSDFTDQKTFSYPFTYAPAAEDVGKTVEFRFVATDVKDNTSEAYYSVLVNKADAVGKMLWSETFNTTMSISNTTEHNTTAGGITGNSATEFKSGKITEYNSLFVPSDPANPDSEKVPNEGAMAGCEVYDGDVSTLVYTCDGTDVCLSKYDNTSVKYMDGAYLWFRKAKKGWFQVDGIKLHGATSLKLTYAQAAQKIKVDYSLDGGATWNEIGATNGSFETAEHKFTLSESAETISLRFTENDGTNHVRIDNLKLIEVL